MRALLLCAALLLCGLAAGACGEEDGEPAGTEEAAEPVPSSPDGPPVVLMFHGGGFLFGDTTALAQAEETAKDLGFEPVLVDYPLGDLPGAVREAEDLARSEARGGRLVYAYGESAGGSLAALLAQRGLVEAAATYAQLTDIGTYLDSEDVGVPNARDLVGATDRQIERFSPGSHEATAPVLALTPKEDDAVRYGQTERWDELNPEVESLDVPGGHLGALRTPVIYGDNVEIAIDWLAERATEEISGGP